MWEAVKKYIVIGDINGIPADEMMSILTTSDLNVAANTDDSYENIADYEECINSYTALYSGSADFIIGAGKVETAEGIATEAKKRGIKTYHIFEPEIEDRCDPNVYEHYIYMYEMVFNTEALCDAVEKIRKS